MTLDKLGRLCLQQLEQNPDMDVSDDTYSMLELASDDTYAEYVNNIYHSIYSALIRFATNGILPIKEAQFPKERYGNTEIYFSKATLELKNSKGVRDFHEIKEVYATLDDNIIEENVSYMVIGSKIRIKNFNKTYDYWVIYSPTIHDLTNYVKKNEMVWDIDLEEMGIPDEMASMVKYYVYADLKNEENASLANNFRNVFESYIADMKTTQVVNVETEYKSGDLFETFGYNDYDNDDFMGGDGNE